MGNESIYIGTKKTREKTLEVFSKVQETARTTGYRGNPSKETMWNTVLEVFEESSKRGNLVKLNLNSKSGIRQILEGFNSTCNERIKKWGFNKKKFHKLINEDYGTFRAFLIDNVVEIMKKKNVNQDDLANDLDYFDNYYGILHARHFAMDIKDVASLVSDTPDDLSDITDEDMQDICDMTIDIIFSKNFAPMTIKVLKTTYTMFVNGVDREVYNVALLSTEPNKGANIGNISSFSFMLDMYPRVYVGEGSNTVRCTGCSIANRREYEMHSKVGSETSLEQKTETLEYCMVGARKACSCACNDCLIFEESIGTGKDIPLDSATIMKIIAHVVRTYKNRASVIRKNTKHKELAKKEVKAITLPKENIKKEKFVSLKDYVKYERREKREWQGGHHSSPVEHERRAHIRRYRDKDGNIVKEIAVKGTTVNKGGDKGIYIVK